MKNQEQQENTLGFYRELTRLLCKKALVIDCCPISLHSHRSHLEKLDFLVDVVNTPRNALKHVCKKKYDLIITSLQLRLNINESIVTQLRKPPSLNGNTPLIVATAGENSLKSRCMQAGAKAVIVKPLTIETLASILHEIFYFQRIQSF